MSIDSEMREFLLGNGTRPAAAAAEPETPPAAEEEIPDAGAVPVVRTEDVQPAPPPTPPPADDTHGGRPPLSDTQHRYVVPPAPGGGKGGRKKDMGQAALNPQQKADAAALLDAFPHVALKLYRYNQITGQRVELGAWPARDKRDIYERARWVTPYSGGGQYVLSVHPPGDFSRTLHEFAFELPGQPLDPAPMRKDDSGHGGLLDGSNMALLAGGGMGKMDLGSLLTLSMLTGKPLFGGQAEKTSAPAHDPELAALRASIDVLKGQVVQGQADAKVKEAEDRHAREMSELRADLKLMSEKLANPPKQESALEKLAPHLPTAFTLLTTVMQQGQQRMDAMLQHFDRQQAESMKMQLEMLKANGGAHDPSKMAGAMGIMAQQFAGLLGTTAQALKAVSAGEGPTTAQVIGEIGGRLLEAGQQALPLIFAMRAAKESPEAAAAVASMMGGAAASPEVAAGKDPAAVAAPAQAAALPQSPVAIPRRGAAPARPPAHDAAPPDGASPDRRFPVVFIHRLVRLVQARVPPEVVVAKSMSLIGVAMDEQTYPPEWEKEPWWRNAFDDLPACLVALAERIGIKLQLEQAYAQAIKTLCVERFKELQAYLAKEHAQAGRSAPPAAAAPPAEAEPAAEGDSEEDDGEGDGEGDGVPDAAAPPTAPVTEG